MTITIAFATGSTAKYRIAATHLAPYGISLQHTPISLPELQSDDVAEIAAFKAHHAYTALGRPVIVEDSGFALTELPSNYPGTQIKHVITAIGAAGVAHLADLTATRACLSTACLAYVDGRGEILLFTNSRPGTVAKTPAGDPGGLPLWTVYCPPGSTLPLAAMPPADHDRWQQWWARHSVFAQLGHHLTGATTPLTADSETGVQLSWRQGGRATHPFVQAAAGLLIRDGAIVLVRQQRDGHPVWSPPGGGAEPGELLHETVRREVAEETGLTATQIGGLGFVVNTDTAAHPSAVIAFFTVTGWYGDISTADEDIDECRLVPFAEAIALLQESQAPRRETEPLISYLTHLMNGQTPAPEVYGYRDDIPDYP